VAILEAVETGHERVSDLRHELDRVREALDRTDAVLTVTDDVLGKAESAIVTTRRVAPYVAVGIGVALTLAVAAVVVWRRRQRAAFDD
jgi:ElaB/YqjD/DUF883 family membrane-anchored ribosome-binding protein